MIRVVAGLIEREGRVLICQRRHGSLFELQWEFPGGKLRAGETPRVGLARELREELGSAARVGREIWRTVHRYPEFDSATEITFFQVDELWPEPRNLAFERMVWVRPGDLPKYQFLAADRKLVARIARKAVRRIDRRKARSTGTSGAKAQSTLQVIVGAKAPTS
jgi:8-oxo-dGTP diphosphatase